MNKDQIRKYIASVTHIDGWFFPIDAWLFGAIDEIQRVEGIVGNLFEIGVHHGKTSLLLGRFARNDEFLGVCDVFEDQVLNKDGSGKGNKEIFLGNMRSLGRIREEQLRVFAKSSAELNVADTTVQCRFFHIDGGHWPDIVVSDLRTADAALHGDGVVAVDDLFNPNWPGVGEGFYRFEREHPGRFCPIAIGGNKVFFARHGFAAKFHKYCSPSEDFSRFVDSAPFTFEFKDWLGHKVLTAIRHAWVDIQPVGAALSHVSPSAWMMARRLLRRS